MIIWLHACQDRAQLGAIASSTDATGQDVGEACSRSVQQSDHCVRSGIPSFITSQFITRPVGTGAGREVPTPARRELRTEL
jgi:hypothetical protein